MKYFFIFLILIYSFMMIFLKTFQLNERNFYNYFFILILLILIIFIYSLRLLTIEVMSSRFLKISCYFDKLFHKI